MGAWGRVLAAMALAVAPIALPNSPAEAAVVDPLHLVFNGQVNGALQMVGNGVLGCPAAAGTPRTECLAASQRQNTFNNNRFAMEYVDVDDDPATYDSSSGQVTIPAGARIAYARLQWGGNRDGNQCNIGSPATYPSGSSQTQAVRLRIGTDAPIDVAPQSWNGDAGSVAYYTADADVTADFAGMASGSPVTITVGNVYAPTGLGCHGGWSLILVHTTDSVPCGAERREIFVYDGHVRQQSSDPPTSVVVSGFKVNGAPGRVGITAYEGDNGQTGDQFRVNGINIAEPVTGATNNFFASTAQNQLNPAYPNNFSVDAKRFDLPPGTVPIGATSATLTTATSGDAYVVQSLTASIPVPALCMTKTVSPTVAHPGDLLTWTINVRNPSDADVLDVAVEDPGVPACARNLATLAAGGSTTYTCTSIADADLTNLATATGTAVDGTSLGATASASVDVLDPSIAVTKTAGTPIVRPGDPITWTVTVENTGDAPLDPVAVDDEPVDACDRTGLGPLAPGGTITYTCTSPSVTGAFVNAVTASGTDTLGRVVTDDDTASFRVVRPALEVTKQADPGVVHTGDSITWSVTVTNTGDSDLAPVTVTDDQVAGCSRTITSLAAGEDQTWTCTSTAGTTDLTNTVSARGSPEAGADVTAAATAAVDVLNPAIQIRKSGSPDAVRAGDTVTWTITVSNAGDAPLDPVSVADPTTPACARNGLGPLGVGDAATYTCTSVAGATSATNTATATGTDELGRAVTDEATATVGLDAPEINVTKVASPDVVRAGDTVTWTVQVTNTGDTVLNNVTVSDPEVPGCTRSFASLAVEQSQTWTCTSTAGSSDLINHVVARGTPPTGAPVESDASAAADVIHPAIELTKVVDSTTAVDGATLTWTLSLTNPGDVPLTTATVTDITVPGCDRTFATLDPGEEQTWSCTSVAGTDDVSNTATARGNAPVGPAVSDDATATVDVIHPGIAVTKTVDPEVAVPGSPVTWTVTAENTGDVELTDVSVVDPSNPACSRSAANVDAGTTRTWTCTATTGQADLVNTITATGTPPTGPTTSASATATVDVIHPALGLTKTADVSTAIAGQTITWTLTLTNPGDTALGPVEVSDTGAPTCDRTVPDLVAGADVTWTCECDAGQDDVTNTAEAIGTPLAGPPVTATASDTVDVVHPDLTVTKSAEPAVAVEGTPITWTITATNTGDVPLSDVAAVDGSVADCERTIGTLTAAESQTWTCASTAGADDVTNTVDVTAAAPLGPPLERSASAAVDVVHPGLRLSKTVDQVKVRAGGLVTFTITATNTGDVTLPQVSVRDVGVPRCSGDDVSLAPGESVTTHCRLRLSSSLTNVAVASSQPPAGAQVSAESSATVTVTPSSLTDEDDGGGNAGSGSGSSDLGGTGAPGGLWQAGLGGLLLVAVGVALVARRH